MIKQNKMRDFYMEQERTNKLGHESIGKLLFNLSIPAATAQLVNILYNVMDRIYIGHIPNMGYSALTGVGVTFPILMAISAFSSLIGMGGAPRAAIKMGQGKYEEAEEILGNCFVSLIGISVILTIIFLISGEKLLLMFGASTETLKAIQTAQSPAEAVTLAGHDLGAEFRQKVAEQEFNQKIQLAKFR
jgi:Na+-driven multidrug efflux pump